MCDGDVMRTGLWMDWMLTFVTGCRNRYGETDFKCTVADDKPQLLTVAQTVTSRSDIFI